MKHFTKRLVSATLVLAMALSLSLALPLTAGAMKPGFEELKPGFEESKPGDMEMRPGEFGNLTTASAMALAEQIRLFPTGGTGSLSAEASGITVTVTGEVTGVTNKLVLDIGSSEKVVWKATYEGGSNFTEIADSLIELKGAGRFEVADGGNLRSRGEGLAIKVTGTNTVTVNGGEVSSIGTFTIAAVEVAATINVDGGAVYNYSSPGVAISGGESGAINITGGTVIGTSWTVITGGIAGTVNITGGFIFGYGETIDGSGDHAVVRKLGAPATIGGTAVVCGWKKPSQGTVYIKGTIADLAVNPGAYAIWAIDEDTGSVGIAYKHVTAVSEVFYRINGVRVIEYDGSISNFTKSRTYTPELFNDVNEDAWYGFNNQQVIAKAYEYALMSGKNDGKFDPEGNLTIAEAITMAVRVNSIYRGDTSELTQGEPWYQVYVNKAIAQGIIKSDTFPDYEKQATRAEMAYIFAHTLPVHEYREQWDVKSPPDVTSATPYNNEIRKLYLAGIVGGSDEAGAFYPDNNIKRAEAAAILIRLIMIGYRLGRPAMTS
ncbi:MAG: S-layer homology domain-containing protein [Oscillospiraceae bacterium]|nr:S-layer homology domain-containing protein [Oscillospiraceae bacterium]